jgi:hypothetical protein
MAVNQRQPVGSCCLTTESSVGDNYDTLTPTTNRIAHDNQHAAGLACPNGGTPLLLALLLGGMLATQACFLEHMLPLHAQIRSSPPSCHDVGGWNTRPFCEPRLYKVCLPDMGSPNR